MQTDAHIFNSFAQARARTSTLSHKQICIKSHLLCNQIHSSLLDSTLLNLCLNSSAEQVVNEAVVTVWSQANKLSNFWGRRKIFTCVNRSWRRDNASETRSSEGKAASDKTLRFWAAEHQVSSFMNVPEFYCDVYSVLTDTNCNTSATTSKTWTCRVCSLSWEQVAKNIQGAHHWITQFFCKLKSNPFSDLALNSSRHPGNNIEGKISPVGKACLALVFVPLAQWYPISSTK